MAVTLVNSKHKWVARTNHGREITEIGSIKPSFKLTRKQGDTIPIGLMEKTKSEKLEVSW